MTQSGHKFACDVIAVQIWIPNEKPSVKRRPCPVRCRYSQLKRARDYMRIRIATWMIVMTMFGSSVMIWWGRKERDEGKSANKMGQAQFDQWRQQGLKEQQQQQNQDSGSHWGHQRLSSLNPTGDTM